MRLFVTFATLASIVFPSSFALAQTAFMEGHVFNKVTGIPLSGAVVQVFEAATARPIPIELAAGLTDQNGFYQLEVNEFLGRPATIRISCATQRGEVQGRSSARLRDGVIRRDVYLEATPNLMRCQEPE